MTYQLIETKTLGTATSAIEFTAIPSTFTDLLFLCSLRSNRSAAVQENVRVSFNGSTSGYSERLLFGTGSGTGNTALSENYFNTAVYSATAAATSNTFNNTMLYIPNYAGSTSKSITADNVIENNATAGFLSIQAGIWANTAAINSVAFAVGFAEFATTFQAGSTISLYGILKGSSGGVVVS
jgi:hypothetical protein